MLFQKSVRRSAIWLVATSLAASFPLIPTAEARTITVNGTLQPTATVTLGSNVSGTVQEVRCEVDGPVKKGELCAQIDPRPFERALDMARANLAAAVAQLQQHAAGLALAKSNYERNATLAERGVVAKTTLDNHQTAYAQAQAQVSLGQALIDQRKAEVAVAELNLSYTAIASPIDGIVLQRKVSAGETIASDFQVPAMFVISTDLSRMHLVARVSEADVGEFKLAGRAVFTVKAFPNRQFVGRIGRIGNAPIAGAESVMYDMIVEVENTDRSLRPGMTAVLKLDSM
jgi:HlyD family secretion protein